MTYPILILGLGNLLLQDEAVGIEVIRELERAGLPEGVRCLDGGTLSFTLAAPIAESSGLIVVDAARLNAAPGEIRVFEGEQMDKRLDSVANSVHEVGLSELLDMARLTDDLPERRALVGIEPEVVDWGETLTPKLRQSIPRAVQEVKALLEAWHVPQVNIGNR